MASTSFFNRLLLAPALTSRNGKLACAAAVPIVILLFKVLSSKPAPVLPPLPKGVQRIYIPAGDKKEQLELLVAEAGPYESEGTEEEAKAPLLFVHGGYGSAFCWTHWITYFSQRGRKVYAISLSGHGRSTRPWFFTLRTKFYFAQDVLSALDYISSQRPAASPLLVGHSAGGGLSQYIVHKYGLELKAESKLSGLVLVSPFPPTGGIPVYLNWLRLDPFLFIRMFLRLGDPSTVLDTPKRVSRAFFGREYTSLHSSTRSEPDTVPDGFMGQMNKEESIVWPSGMMLPFVDTRRVLRHITFGVMQRIYLIAGSDDALMSPNIMKDMNGKYGCGVGFIEGAGHHLMQDKQWKDGAQVLENKLTEWGI
ncbi:Alpha/Beta hydrolase protein [Crucibulum laeve]|uniref:Alpha/Beta hydrolase protein n=1 Tax=Crucibulum laeve TaxID=68775 RepID=A0A5C3M2I1_9AGAR|nr:Alpha/Beta hydrolase protein [Crucibulum laeve]